MRSGSNQRPGSQPGKPQQNAGGQKIMVKRHESPRSRRQIVAGFEQSQPGSANSGYKKYYQNPDN